MAIMNDIQRVITSLEARDEPCVMATVVHTEGSTYRRAGARMVIFPDGSSHGAISGGCLESDVIESSTSVFDNGVPKLLRYDSLSDDDDPIFGLGMGCNGVTTVFLERLDGSDDTFCAFVRSCFDNRQSGVIATVYDIRQHDTDSSLTDEVSSLTSALEGYHFFLYANEEASDNLGDSAFAEFVRETVWSAAIPLLSTTKPQQMVVDNETISVSVLLEPVQPLRELILWGAGYDAIPLVKVASMMGWRTTVIDHRPALLTPERFSTNVHTIRTTRDSIRETAQNLVSEQIHPNTAVVIMTHNLVLDAAILQAVLPSKAGYIGLLGPKPRLEKLVKIMKDEGFSPPTAALERLHNPIGLDIGSETAEEVALSIIAEIQAAMNVRKGGFLKQRKQAKIHE